MIDGTLETIDDRPALRFERTLPHSVERVWRAISDPAELERWFPAAAEGHRRQVRSSRPTARPAK